MLMLLHSGICSEFPVCFLLTNVKEEENIEHITKHSSFELKWSSKKPQTNL